MAPPRGRITRRAGRAIARGARRAGTVARRSAKAQLPAVGIAIGGALVGLADARGLFNKLPAIGGSRAATLGLLGYAATRYVKNPTIRLAGIAAIAAAAFDFGKVHGAPKQLSAGKGAHGIDEAMSGQEDVSGHDDDSRTRGDGGPY